MHNKRMQPDFGKRYDLAPIQLTPRPQLKEVYYAKNYQFR